MALLRNVSRTSIWGVATVAICTACVLGAEPADQPANQEQANKGEAGSTVTLEESPAMSIEAARKQATLMHSIYLATLEVMHQHYFHENKSVLPARAMEDIFAELADETKIKSNWIAVNTKAMSVHHEPKSEFEMKAAAELRAGKEAYERVEKGFYYRAAPVSLGAGCVSCHTNFFTTPPKTPRLAGLIIGIPVQGAAEQAKSANSDER